MKFVLSLLLICASALAEGAREKPAIIQDGPPAHDYIELALYDYLEKPPYLLVQEETPFCLKRLHGNDTWIAFVEFYCGPNERQRLHCITVLAFDPLTGEHQFITPENLVQAMHEIRV